MLADVPHIQISHAAPMVRLAPAAIRTLAPRVYTRGGITLEPLVAPYGCRIEHSHVTVAGRRMGVQAMVTFWCPRDDQNL